MIEVSEMEETHLHHLKTLFIHFLLNISLLHIPEKMPQLSVFSKPSAKILPMVFSMKLHFLFIN